MWTALLYHDVTCITLLSICLDLISIKTETYGVYVCLPQTLTVNSGQPDSINFHFIRNITFSEEYFDRYPADLQHNKLTSRSNRFLMEIRYGTKNESSELFEMLGWLVDIPDDYHHV